MAPEASEPLGWGKIVVYDAQRVLPESHGDARSDTEVGSDWQLLRELKIAKGNLALDLQHYSTQEANQSFLPWECHIPPGCLCTSLFL